MMTKQGEIREGIEALIPVNYITSSVKESKRVATDKILAYLHSQGLRLPNGESLIEVENGNK